MLSGSGSTILNLKNWLLFTIFKSSAFKNKSSKAHNSQGEDFQTAVWKRNKKPEKKMIRPEISDLLKWSFNGTQLYIFQNKTERFWFSALATVKKKKDTTGIVQEP